MREAASIRALLSLLCISAHSSETTNEAIAFGWSETELRFSTACAMDGDRVLRDGGLDCWLGEHPEVMAALQRGEDVAFAGRVFLPIAGSAGLEGVLSIAINTPFSRETRMMVQEMCRLAAIVLASLRERDQALRMIATAARELGKPLAAARGFTRMALEDAHTVPQGYSEFLSAALKNINRLGEVAVGLQHAGADG